MSSEDKFKKLLQQKLSEKEFSFNPDNWEKARRSIDASRNKRKRRAGFLIWSLLLLFLGTLSFFIFYPNKNSLVVSEAEPFAKQNNRAEDDEATKSQNPEQIDAAGTTKKSTPNSETVFEKSSPAPQQKQMASAVSAHPSQHSPAKNSNNTPSASAIQPVLIMVAAPVKYNDNAPGIKENVSQTDLSPVRTDSETPLFIPEVSENVSVKKDTVIPAAITEVLPPTPTAKDTATSSTPTLLARADTITPATTPTITMNEAVFPRNLFFIEAGSNYMAGWKSQGRRDANGFNPVLAIGYMNFITRKIALSIGVQYTSVSNLSTYSHTSKNTTLGLGEENGVTVITPTKMHYLGGFLKLNLAASDKNVFGIGYTLNYLIAMQDKVDSYEQRTNFAPQPHTLSKTTGYAEGFSKFDSQISLFYRRMLYRKLWINAEIIYGITDIKNNTFFGSNTFDHDLGLKLSLMYNLFKK